ncbi:DNA invertase Pin-like site-specific DNA recombinase [Marmoricola sp. URHA0025 HA25]
MSVRRDAIYARISSDPEGRELGVERQIEDAQKLAARDGRPSIAADYIFRDNDRSASSKSRKQRDDWKRLLALIAEGRIARVYSYSNSRLTRRPAELEALITLHEQTGVEFHTVVSGKDDLSTVDGRMWARMKGNIDAAEAERIGERLARKHLQSAQTGKVVGGTRPFGWQPDKIELDPMEAAAGRRVIEGFLAGRTLHSLVRELQDAGVTTSLGNPWSMDALRKWIGNPRLCGWRRLHGGIVTDGTGTPIIGEWRPLVDTDTWSAANAILESRKRQAFGPGGPLGTLDAGWDRRKYLLSGLARCGKPGPNSELCMKALRVDPRRGKSTHMYVCPSRAEGGCGGIGRRGDVLDAYVIEAVLVRAEGLDLTADALDDWDGQVALDRLVAKRRSLMESWSADGVSDESYFPMLRSIDKQIGESRRAKDLWVFQRARAGATPVDLRAEWAQRTDDLDWKRSVIFRHLHSVVVLPVGGGRKPFDPNGVRLAWRED